MKQVREVLCIILSYMAFMWLVTAGLMLNYAIFLWAIQKDVDNSM